MGNIRPDLLYTKEHEWVLQLDERRVLVGITDYAQSLLGDIVFVELPEPNASVMAGASMGSVESVKAVSDIYCPVSGIVAKVNADLESNPEKVNIEPYEGGWTVEIELSDSTEINQLLNAEQYAAIVDEDAS